MRISAMVVGLTLAALAGEAAARQVRVETTPEGAACTARQRGATVDYLAQTPGRLSFDPSYAALEVACEKAGYAPATYSVGDADAAFLDIESSFDWLQASGDRARLRNLHVVRLTLTPE